MIEVAGSIVRPDELTGQYAPGGVETEIIRILSAGSRVYRYSALDQLRFEIDLRKSIVNAAIKLNRSRFAFRIFRESRCNPAYWERTDEGGFLLKSGISPYSAINDIYINSRLYATECATAIVIVFYKALADLFPEELFNQLFSVIYLMNWQHLDKDMGIAYIRNPGDHIPGDCLYFKNPDVSPDTPQWQGENVIDLGNGMYYGHGIGIQPAAVIIEVLNSNRVPGSQTSAYLLNSATRPDFRTLASRYFAFHSGQRYSALAVLQ